MLYAVAVEAAGGVGGAFEQMGVCDDIVGHVGLWYDDREQVHGIEAVGRLGRYLCRGRCHVAGKDEPEEQEWKQSFHR